LQAIVNHTAANIDSRWIMTGLLTILGPTASGKTKLAANVAYRVGGEVISADSRQVFRYMDIGTGKDRDDYIVDNVDVPVHLVDMAEPGTEFSVFNFITAYNAAYLKIAAQGKTAVLCGGTGLYLDAVLRNYQLTEVPVNAELRETWADRDDKELTAMLCAYKPLHNITDTVSRERLLRALEIEYFKTENQVQPLSHDFSKTPVFGVRFERLTERERITLRLKSRLDAGMIDEVEALINRGIVPQRLKQYGLEYKYVTQYITGEIDYQMMFRLLNTAIHQFAKRQMTWFRRMERNGVRIIWLRGEDGWMKNTETILQCVDQAINY